MQTLGKYHGRDIQRNKNDIIMCSCINTENYKPPLKNSLLYEVNTYKLGGEEPIEF